MNKESLKEYLSSRYQGWNSFLSNVIFPIFGENDFEDGFETELLESQPERRQLAEATGIRSIKQVGMMYVGVEPLQIFDVTVSDRVMMERNRVNIQRLIRAVMDQFSCAFMLFHYEDDTRWDWRFTYCRKSGNKEETTDSKRYTFLLGPGQSCRTATDNFMALYDKRDSLEIKDIEDAFNVEALSKEFFGKYKAQYEAFVNYMVDPANGMRQDFIDTDFDHTGMKADKIRDREEKPIRDYVKKLLGRIVFLHFLQKKGWLGVPAGKEWGEGDRDFMLNIFKNATERQKENFLDDILEDLFEEGLDRNRSDRGDLYDTKVEGFRNCRIPYLNGGLFERDNLDKKPSHFPASYFDGLLTMLSQYNFTIDENDPNDAEVGVDPEMLGRIFENLLEDNKDKGAFYTPKEIVQYMCRESLIAYLQTDQREEDKNCIRQFVTTHDAALLGDLKEDIDQKLCDVKICDPAIGSGAFPMGLLRELFFCRSAIEPNIVENAANIKRHIIQNNIYGVDIERGAVDIARLRFWLSLIVDEKSPEALPNLDFKIMQGNSLLEQYKGADLSTMTEKKVDSEHGITLFDSMLDVYRKNLRDKLAEYYICPKHDKKVQLRKDIADIVKQELIEQGIQIDFEDIDLSANSQFFLWHTWFHDVFSRPAHEVGHSNQTKPGLCWHGMGEVTNNIHSLYVQTSFGNPSRLLDLYNGKTYTIYEKGLSAFFTQRRPHVVKDDKVDELNQLIPFWQLYLYTKAMGNEDFYKDLYELVRTRPDKATPGESQLEFTVLACEAAQLDLTKFFTRWGFFEPVDIIKNDYGEKQFVVTEEMVDDAQKRIAAFGFSQPTKVVEYITDVNIDCYTGNSGIIKGTAQREGQKIIMINWRNVAVYEVYSDGKLCFVSPASSFTVNGNLGTKVQVFAVSATGEKVEVTF